MKLFGIKDLGELNQKKYINIKMTQFYYIQKTKIHIFGINKDNHIKMKI